MNNQNPARSASLSGPASDIQPVLPDDENDLPTPATALYAETGGTVSIITISGEERQVVVADFSILPVRVQRVRSTGTTALGLHALVLG